jgi:sedoheptulose-bisphosphatase
LLFECAPIALIIEAAGGSTCVASCEAMSNIEPVSMLDVEISYLDKRVGCCFGSTDEVNRFKEYMFSPQTEFS